MTSDSPRVGTKDLLVHRPRTSCVPAHIFFAEGCWGRGIEHGPR